MSQHSGNGIFGPISHNKILSIMPTYRCTAECENCGTMSSPREKARLQLPNILRAIDEAANAGYGTIVFTGGEATLVGADLLKAIEHAALLKLGTRLVTNAHWANSDRAAERKIRALVAAGLNEINYSTGDQHVRFVPLDNILRAISAAVTGGLRVSVMVETVAERTITKESITQHPAYQLLINSYPGVVDIHESPWMPLDPMQSQSYTEGMATNRNNLEGRGGCDSILSTTTLQADGRLGACCGLGMRLIPELQLGHISNITIGKADEVGKNDFLKRWIRIEGPEKILAWAAEHNPDIVWENIYAHRCQACIRLYQDPLIHDVITQHYEEKIPDILFGEWLLYHYNVKEIS
ncbi:radical SAM protein [Bacillus wiedmannii]|uniref:radical SAM protein n=1 Tax=Bacillus wiedmannii TaxID=1890302 RepID=UPI000B43CAFB|nr:radical SAM protein [Bacillus thuringiensis serovar argentinensis]